MPPSSPYAVYDPLRWKGVNIPLPGPADTLDQAAGGFRQSLADLGIGYFAYTNSYYENNLLPHLKPGKNPNGSKQAQIYVGQIPTYFSTNDAFVTYDLSRYGIPNGQLTLGGTFLRTSWNSAGPNATVLSQATYYQTLFNNRIELKIGYLANSFEFFGTHVGGSLAGGLFGPNAGLSVEQGLNSVIYPTPGINVTINLTPQFYTKFGVERAISPDGVTVEANENPSGVRFAVPNAGPLFINETGYRTMAAPGRLSTWIRADITYNNSWYKNYQAPGHRGNQNYGFFMAADREVLQFDRPNNNGTQGIYAGFSVEYVPPALNKFSQYYEARLYSFGLIPSRPRDQTSIVITDNVFSHILVNEDRAAGLLTNHNSLAVTTSYSARVWHGVNLNLGFSYVNHPSGVTYTSNTGCAFNIIVGAVVFF
jgi:porin